MNASNRYSIDAMARERPAEIEKHLRTNAKVDDSPRGHAANHLNLREAMTLATISAISAIALALVAYVH